MFQTFNPYAIRSENSFDHDILKCSGLEPLFCGQLVYKNVGRTGEVTVQKISKLVIKWVTMEYLAKSSDLRREVYRSDHKIEVYLNVVLTIQWNH